MTINGFFVTIISWQSTVAEEDPSQITLHRAHNDEEEDGDNSTKPTISLLPRVVMPSSHCNGLLLHESEWRCFISNPCSHVSVPKPEPLGSGVYGLAFDPRVSPHYTIVHLRSSRSSSGSGSGSDSDCCIDPPQLMVYSSASSAWRTEDTGRAKLPRYISDSRTTFCDGALYFAFEADDEGGPGVLRVGLKEIGEVDGVSMFKLPMGCEGALGRMGRIGEKLCWIELYKSKLNVWALRRRGEEGIMEWEKMHESAISGKQDDPYARDVQFLASNPFVDAIYILLNGRMFMYDLGSTEMKMVCELDSDDIKVCNADVIPLSPCLLDNVFER